jgi:hypothetical protein
MNPNAQFERDLEQWLQAEAPASAPAGFHASVMDRARTLRQRPGWTTTFPARSRGLTLLAAAALLLVGGALAGGSGLLRLPTVVPPVPEPSVITVATASPDPTLPSPSESAAPSASPIPVAGPGGAWLPTGSMGTPRENPTAVRLQDGRVLVVGGYSGPSGYAQRLTSAELYDPATGTWFATGSNSKPLVENAAMLLVDGTVLVQVGDDPSSPSGAEVYDPATGTWTATGPMVRDSDGGTLTVLRDGRLLAGGDGPQVYDPATGTWTATDPMVRYSGGDTFTVLRDGRVLDWAGAQMYDPNTGTWTAAEKRKGEGFGAAAVLLSDGKVLVAGGTGFKLPDNYFDLDSAEVYDPVTGSWTAIASMHAKANPTAAFLQPDGKVLVMSPGGAEVYDPSTGTWTAFPGRPGSEYGTATLLSDGTVLATGGDCTVADLYDPHTGSWTTGSTMVGCGSAGSFTLLLDGTVLVAGGWACNGDECGSSGAAELYVPAGVSLPPFSFPPPAPYVVPSPMPVPTPFPPADGPVPPNARSWKVTVDNDSSEPVTLSVVGGGSRLVGSATPNVVPAGATVQVTFRFPADEDGWIYVDLRPGDGGGLVNADQIGIPGKIWIREDGEVGWLSP